MRSIEDRTNDRGEVRQDTYVSSTTDTQLINQLRKTALLRKSKHVSEDRLLRLKQYSENELYHIDFVSVYTKVNHATNVTQLLALSSTGLAFIFNETGTKLITIFVANHRKLRAFHFSSKTKQSKEIREALKNAEELRAKNAVDGIGDDRDARY